MKLTRFFGEWIGLTIRFLWLRMQSRLQNVTGQSVSH